MQASVARACRSPRSQARGRAGRRRHGPDRHPLEAGRRERGQAEAGAFLAKAFGAAIFLIFVVLLAQFNKFTSVWLVLSAVVMSTIGVLLGLMIMGQPFGIVMSGIGIIALAGVVVNNNIVLIDTYDTAARRGHGTRSTRSCRPAASARVRWC